jgi:hypothetical protein
MTLELAADLPPLKLRQTSDIDSPAEASAEAGPARVLGEIE